MKQTAQTLKKKKILQKRKTKNVNKEKKKKEKKIQTEIG